MKQTMERNGIDVPKNIVISGMNLELPPSFHEAMEKTYKEYLEKKQALDTLAHAGIRRRRRNAKLDSYRSFIRDTFYQKFESGEWTL